MNKFSLSGLSVLMALIAFLGFSPQAWAYFPLGYQSWADVPVDPANGTVVTDISQLQTITLTLPEGNGSSVTNGAYFTKSTMYKAYLVKEGETEDVRYGKYTFTLNNTKDVLTLTRNDLADLGPGVYQVYTTGQAFAVRQAGGATALNCPIGALYTFTYNPGGANSLPFTPSIEKGSFVSASDFQNYGIKFSCENIYAQMNYEKLTDTYFTCNGKQVTATSGYNVVKPPLDSNLTGVVEFHAPEGLFYATADGETYYSPETDLYFYVGDLAVTTTPANGGSIAFDVLSAGGFTIGYPDNCTATINKDAVKGKGYMEFGSNKMLAYYTINPDDNNKLIWIPTFYDEDAPTADVAATVSFPEGTYKLNFDGKEFNSPALEFSFTVTPHQAVAVADITYTTTPAASSSVEGPLKEFAINFACDESAVTSFATNENIRAGHVTIQYGEDEAYSNNYGLTEGSTPGAWTIDLPISVTADTQVTITARAGAYIVTLADGRVQESPEVTSTFTLTPKAAPVVITYTTTPADGATVQAADFDRIYYTFMKGETATTAVEVAETSQSATLTINGTPQEIKFGVKSQWVAPKSADIEKAGTWDLTIPAGYYDLYFTNDLSEVATPNPELHISFTVEAEPKPVVVNYTTTPADGAKIAEEDFTGVTVAFPEATNVAFDLESAPENIIFKYNGEDINPMMSEDRLTFTPARLMPSTAGTWTFGLPEGFYTLTIDGRTVPSPAISATFTVEGAPAPVEIPAPFNQMILDPAADTTVTSAADLGSITFSFPGDGALDTENYYFTSFDSQPAFDRVTSLRKVLGNGEYETIGTYSKGTNVGGDKKNARKITLDLTGKNLTDGDYQVVVAPGVIKVKKTDKDSSATVQETELVYNYKLDSNGSQTDPEPVVVNYTTVPAKDAQVDALSQFQVNFTDATAADLDWEKLSADVVTLKYGDTTLSYGSGLNDDQDDATIIRLDKEFAPATPTLCTVNFKEGAYKVTLNGKTVASPAIEFSFTVGKEAAPSGVDPNNPFASVTIDPAEGQVAVNKFGKVTLYAPEGGYYFSNISYGSKKLQKKNAEGNYEDIATYTTAGISRNEAKTEAYLTLSDETLADLNLAVGDEVRISFGSGAFNMFNTESGVMATAKSNKARTFDYTISAVYSPNGPGTDPDPVEPGELTWTTTPAADAQVDALAEFAVNFEGVKGYAWANDNAMPNVKLTYEGGSKSYMNGFSEGNEINVMVLDEPLTFAQPTQVTATFAAGLYTLTLTDGTDVASPAISFTFTVGKEYTGPVRVDPVSTVPAANAQVDELEEFTVNFADVKEYAFLSDTELPDITLTYDDTTLSYTEGFAESVLDINTMVLDNKLEPNKPTKVTVKYGEGIYKMTLNDGSVVTNNAFEFTFTVGKNAPVGNDAWVPVTDINDLDGKEVAFVWYYDGTPAGPASAPGKVVADPVTNKVESCIVMNTTEITSIRDGKLRSSEFQAEAINADDYVTENGKLTAIRTMPEVANIVKAHKTADGYTFEFTNYVPSSDVATALDLNLDAPLYMAPNPDIDSNVQSLQPSNEQYYNSVTVSASGTARVSSNYRDDADQLSACPFWNVYGPSSAAFNYIHQIHDQGNLYLMVKKTDEPKATLVANPANQSTIEASVGTEKITFSVDGYNSAAVNNDVTLTAKFNGQDAALTLSNTYPVEATVTVPANTDGTLVISIPEGWLQVEDGELILNTSAYEYTLNFKSKLAVADVDITLSPANGSTVQSINTITVTFPANVEEAEINEDAVFNATLDGHATSTPMLQDVATFKYRPEYSEAGVYTFTLAEGFYILTLSDGTKALSPEVSTTVTINPYGSGENIHYTTTPAANSTVDELTEFSVNFEGVSEVAFGNVESPSAFSISYGTTTLTYGTDFEEGAGANDPITTMVLKEALTFDTPTVVTVSIAEGAYLLTLADESMVMSPAIEFSFTVDKNNSITYLVGEGANNDVYTTTGIRVLKDATKADFNQLAPGLYIVGGKVVYKK
ncbi:MAG: hypothetical protein NC217_02345 [Muribaculaceae bacterium]|nr:hypothetical protein [Muribaculaceae bacterium]